MLKEALEKLISLGDPTFHEEDDGRIYSSRQIFPIESPLIKPVEIQTLTGFRDLHKLNDERPAIIHIENHESVWLMAKGVDQWNRRPALVHAKLPSDSPKFRFGQWLDPEEFCIGLMTLFEDADNQFGDHRKVLKLVNSLAAEAVTTSTDDGFSQQVVTKQGLVTKAEEKVSPRVNLAPYRTFREVTQPDSDFILRLRSRQGQVPQCSLWEADGGEWKNTAIKHIREYFQKELPGADIVA